jgi:hypothetical protein
MFNDVTWLGDAAVLLGVGLVSLWFSRYLRHLERRTAPGLTEDDVQLSIWPNGSVTRISRNGHSEALRSREDVR